jgi:hypothetical protein
LTDYILTAFFEQLTEDQKTYELIMQDNDMTHTTNKFMRALAEVFSEQM